MPTLLEAKAVAAAIETELQNEVETFKKSQGRTPRLVVVLVGENPASQLYVKRKSEAAKRLGIRGETITLPATSTPAEVRSRIAALNSDPDVDGILIQRPLPPSFKEEEVLYWVHPSKDVDAFHPENAGRLWLGLDSFQPCTPAGVMELLKHYKIPVQGKTACVLGRSSIVGKPMAALLLQADATVLHCHSKTPQLESLSKSADLVIVAIGQPEHIDERFIKPGAVVVDVGIHRAAEGRVVGDVRFDRVAPIASAITPVPGGVGPMTIGILMRNTVRAAKLRAR